MARTKQPIGLKAMARLAKRKGYEVEIRMDHIIAKNENGSIRTGSMTTLKKVIG